MGLIWLPFQKAPLLFCLSTGPLFTPPPQNRTKNYTFSPAWFPNPAVAREGFEIGARLRMGGRGASVAGGERLEEEMAKRVSMRGGENGDLLSDQLLPL